VVSVTAGVSVIVGVSVAAAVIVTVAVKVGVGDNVGVFDGITYVIVGVGGMVRVGVAVASNGFVGIGGRVEVEVPPHNPMVAVNVTVGVIFCWFLTLLPIHNTTIPNR
jgi:hypothetical protein